LERYLAAPSPINMPSMIATEMSRNLVSVKSSVSVMLLTECANNALYKFAKGYRLRDATGIA